MTVTEQGESGPAIAPDPKPKEEVKTVTKIKYEVRHVSSDLEKVRSNVKTQEELANESEMRLTEDLTSQVESLESRLAARRIQKGLEAPSSSTEADSQQPDEFKEIFNVLDQLEKENNTALEAPEKEEEEQKSDHTPSDQTPERETVTDMQSEGVSGDAEYQRAKNEFIQQDLEEKSRVIK